MPRTTESLGAPKEASKRMRLLNICQNLLSDLLFITLLTHHHFQVGVFWIQFQLKFRESLNERFLWYNCITDKRKATLKKTYKETHQDFHFQQKLEIGGGRRRDSAFQLDTQN